MLQSKAYDAVLLAQNQVLCDRGTTYLIRQNGELDAAPHGLSDTFRLLMDLFLHEVVVAALHDVVDLHFQGLQHSRHCQ